MHSKIDSCNTSACIYDENPSKMEQKSVLLQYILYHVRHKIMNCPPIHPFISFLYASLLPFPSSYPLFSSPTSDRVSCHWLTLWLVSCLITSKFCFIWCLTQNYVLGAAKEWSLGPWQCCVICFMLGIAMSSVWFWNVEPFLGAECLWYEVMYRTDYFALSVLSKHIQM